ncbi:perlucin-like isoform X2 [Dreissena polymorpha]|nr:perlucin-like isoform X2 [Dreissena polymorpha]
MTRCPDGWVYFRQSCYQFADEMKFSLTEATHHCSSRHAHLAKVESKAEDLFLQDFAGRLYKHVPDHTFANSFWLGGTDSNIEGIWTWYSDDSDLIYTSWPQGHPGPTGDHQDCLILFAPNNYQWYDFECEILAHPLCEIELNVEAAAVVIG